MRLIDADALKKAIQNYYLTCALDNEVYNIIDNAPTVKTYCYFCGQTEHGQIEERPHGEWISVSERLPEHANQSYLVTVDYGDGIICSCQRFFFNEDIGWTDDCVIAWQPLPEPYKKGGAK